MTLGDPLGLNTIEISHPGCSCTNFFALITAFIPTSEVSVLGPLYLLSSRKYAQKYRNIKWPLQPTELSCSNENYSLK